MILDIIGWMWVITGVLFLVKPVWLQKTLQKKVMKKLRWAFIAIVFTVGGGLIASAWGMKGLAPKIVVIIGIIAIVKGFLLFNEKATEKVVDWFTGQSLMFYRIWSSCQIIAGLVAIFIIK